MSTSLRWELRK